MKVRETVVASIAFLAPMISTAAVAFPPAVLIWGQLQLNGEAARPIAGIEYTHEIQPIAGKTAKILCRRTFHTVDETNAFTLADVCPEVPDITERDGVEVPRGGNDRSIPYIISPRKSQVLSSRPLIRWNEVETADFYTVTLLGPAGEVWSRTTQAAEMPYPSDEVPLVEEVNYAIQVTTNLGVSSDEGIPGLTFSVMGQDERRQVDMAIEQLVANDVAIADEAYAKAYIYQSYSLLSKGITTLEKIEQDATYTSIYYQALGGLYVQARLNYHARDAYLTSLELAQNSDLIKEEAPALLALGNIYLLLNDVEEAISYLEQARTAYIEMEGSDSDIIENIDKQLIRLSP